MSLRTVLTLATLTAAASAAGPLACGGGTSGSSSPSLGARAEAARQTAATNALCTALTPFYWEIGDATGTLASGQGGVAGTAVDPAATMPVASASKLIFGAYALQRSTIDRIAAAGGVPFLNFTSGYHGLSDLLCELSATVSACFTAGNGDVLTASDQGKFFYDGAHLQAYAVNLAGLGPDRSTTVGGTPQLADDIQAQIGQIGLTYGPPALAGGARVSPNGYAAFLRSILSGALNIRGHLGEQAVCAWTHHADCDALYSPVNESAPGAATNDVSDLKWHYALAHWVEDDGAFSSPGAFGFYPWIDASKTWYGLVARDDRGTSAMPPPSYASVTCGRAIRAAWTSGTAQ
jgi:hypothetical protein